jgi:hypothetical protein
MENHCIIEGNIIKHKLTHVVATDPFWWSYAGIIPVYSRLLNRVKNMTIRRKIDTESAYVPSCITVAPRNQLLRRNKIYVFSSLRRNKMYVHITVHAQSTAPQAQNQLFSFPC